MEERRILDSWKEISAYLNRSVMTCQRWEKELDLPVHRLDGTPKARVFAYPEEIDRWQAEKRHAHETHAKLGKTIFRRIWRWGLITAAVLFSLGITGALIWRLYLHPAVPAPAQVPSLAVLPFVNDTGEPAWDAWRLALPDLLTIDLRQSKFMDVVKTSNLFQTVGPLAEADSTSSEDLKTMADKAGVDYVLSGNVHKANGKIVIAGVVLDTRTGRALGSPRSVCPAEKDVFACVDKLSRGVRTALNLKPRQIRGDIDRPAASITTDSPEAFKLYSQAYRVQGQGKFDQAIEPLRKAVEIDPRFGLAYRLLSHACLAMSRTDETRKYGELAVRWADRIEERERYLFLAGYFESEPPDKTKALDAYRRLGAHYPYDLTMIGLAEFYTSQEEWGRAIPVLEKLILRYPRRISIVRSLLSCYQSVGRYGEAEKVLDDRLGPDPKPGRDTTSLLLNRYGLALAQNKFDIAHACAERMKTADSSISSYFSNKGFVYFLQDDLSNAEKMYQGLVESDRPRAQMNGFRYLAAVSLSRGRIEEAKQRTLRAIELVKGLDDYGPPMEKPLRCFLAYLERLSGRLPEALKQVDLAYEAGKNEGLVFAVQILYLRALITLELDRFEEFEKQVEEIRKYLDPDRDPWGAPRFMRVYYNLLGHRELQKGHCDLAIQYFWKALDLLSPYAAQSFDADHAKYYYDLAEAYRLSGSLPDAAVMYEKVVLPTVSREYSGDLYAKSYYWTGLDSERMMLFTGVPALARERRQKAIGNYRRFLGLWGDADPIFPEVEDARKRLAALESR